MDRSNSAPDRLIILIGAWLMSTVASVGTRWLLLRESPHSSVSDR